jgi:hypothetical protein
MQTVTGASCARSPCNPLSTSIAICVCLSRLALRQNERAQCAFGTNSPICNNQMRITPSAPHDNTHTSLRYQSSQQRMARLNSRNVFCRCDNALVNIHAGASMIAPGLECSKLYHYVVSEINNFTNSTYVKLNRTVLSWKSQWHISKAC